MPPSARARQQSDRLWSLVEATYAAPPHPRTVESGMHSQAAEQHRQTTIAKVATALGEAAASIRNDPDTFDPSDVAFFWAAAQHTPPAWPLLVQAGILTQTELDAALRNAP